MQNTVPSFKIKVHPPKISPKITAIGFGNPRYNSMISYKQGALLTVGSHLRWVDIQNNKILMDKQIGWCQIFQIMENLKYIMTVNFDGLITLLNKQNFQVSRQFYGPGKQIRHSSFTNDYISISCQLNEGSEQSLLCVYRIENIESGQYKPIQLLKGHYYYPQYLENQLTVVEYKDPNPKGRKRKQTVMAQKLPITNRIVKFNHEFVVTSTHDIKEEGEIISATQNKGIIYYLHTGKKLTIFDIKGQRKVELTLQSKQFPHVLEPYLQGVIYPISSNTLTYLTYDFDNQSPKLQNKVIKSLAIGGNLSLKFSENGIYSMNQNGLHYYCNTLAKTFTQSLFSITNCGITFNGDGSMLAVADFGGTVHVFSTEQISILPEPIFSVFVGIPIRSLAWCKQTNNIVIGCVGGSLFWWKYGNADADLVMSTDHTFNIIRAADSKIYAGTSDGQISIFDSATMNLLRKYKAHHPIHYESEEQREMFGSMKNYAEIWSIALSPNKEELFIVSGSQDQSEKVFKANQKQQIFELQHHLKGHELAVTSIDWKVMGKNLGQIYVSCSDDKVIRFRDPKDGFKILFEVQTTTIKEWHTLTYLALEPNGHRVAVGSQNGYLFIYDIFEKDLLYGEKIHLGGIEGLDWKGNKICTCSSDLCINIIEL